MPDIIPISALGRAGTVAPSERIIIGVIGLGGRGRYDLEAMLVQPGVQCVAVCDVNQERREAGKKIVDAKHGSDDCATYRDFRELLAERKDIDALLIATGNRWHTPLSILAMQAGKDVYCEKPCGMSIAEGQALVRAARQNGRIYQGGMQRLSEGKFVFADQLARTGRLGKIHTVRAHILRWQMKSDMLPAQPEPDRETLDWDMWLGPAPRRPYNRAYLPSCGAWMNYYDFGGGVAEWGSHTIAQCQSALNLLHTSAVEYEFPNNDTADDMVSRFADGTRLVLSDCKWRDPVEAASGWRGTCGIRYEGSEGWVSVADDYTKPDVSAPSLLKEIPNLLRDYQAQTGRPLNHIEDFLNCVRSRRPCVASEVVAHRSMTTNHALNISMQLKRNLKWDPEKEEFVDDAEANGMKTRAGRAPWQIPT